MAAIGVSPHDALSGFAVLGELGLDGSIAPVAGVLPAAIGANAHCAADYQGRISANLILSPPTEETKSTASTSPKRCCTARSPTRSGARRNSHQAPLATWIAPRIPIAERNSCRVSAWSRNTPNMRLVTMLTPVLWMPRVVMH